MERPSLSALFIKYLNNECTPAEVDELMELLENDTPTPEMETLLQNALSNELEPVGYSDPELRQRLENRLGQIMQQTGQTERPRSIRMMWAMAAAVVIMLIGAGAWYFLLRNKPEAVVAQQKPAVQNDALPGDNRAILTLADGSKVVLDSAGNGLLAQQGSAQVLKTKNGVLQYDAISNGQQAIAYNSLSTPRGGQYQLVLPDGSKVWLNAASSIRYPTAFTDSERKVEITGEVYFEIEKLRNASGQRIPFKVAILPSTGGVGGGRPGGLIEVLGTHFNINAYDDEPTVNTTLLEGAVRVTQNAERITLKPGQQAVLSAHSPLTINHSPNLEQVMAWKNQLFKFDNDDLQKVMRQLARWYDVDVVYDRNASLKETFAGEMQRSLKLSQVLKGLEGMNVHFKIEGRHLIVLP